MDLSNCGHELCNRSSTKDMLPEEVESVILCGVKKGIFELVIVDGDDGSTPATYRLSDEYKAHLGIR